MAQRNCWGKVNKQWAVIMNTKNDVEIVYQPQSSENNYVKFSDAKNAAIYFLMQQIRKQNKNLEYLKLLRPSDCRYGLKPIKLS